MSIYKDLLDAVDNGKKFKVDLKDKSLWIDKKKIIEKGEVVDESKELIKPWDLSLNYGALKLDEEPWKVIEFLYAEYKCSVPGKHSNKKSYFKALPVSELNDKDLAFNIDREFGQCMIEGYILLASLSGWLTWKHGNHWFWQGKDKDLVVLKSFIE